MTNEHRPLTEDDKLQIEQASRGCISGRLEEWPELKNALRLCGYYRDPETSAIELGRLCRMIVDSWSAVADAPEAVTDADGLRRTPAMIQERNSVSGLPMWRHSSNGDLRAAKDDGWMDANGWEPVMVVDAPVDLQLHLRKKEFVGCLKNDGGRGPHKFDALDNNGRVICEHCRQPAPSAEWIPDLATEADDLRLKEILSRRGDEYVPASELAALKAEVERLKQALEVKPGGCKILSLGDECDCTLCRQSKEFATARETIATLKDNLITLQAEHDEELEELRIERKADRETITRLERELGEAKQQHDYIVNSDWSMKNIPEIGDSTADYIALEISHDVRWSDGGIGRVRWNNRMAAALLKARNDLRAKLTTAESRIMEAECVGPKVVAAANRLRESLAHDSPPLRYRVPIPGVPGEFISAINDVKTVIAGIRNPESEAR